MCINRRLCINWTVGTNAKHIVSVYNGTDASEGVAFSDAYVRLQFKQFMAISDKTYQYTDERYMIDTEGNFIKFLSGSETDEYSDVDAFKGRIKELHGYFDG